LQNSFFLRFSHVGGIRVRIEIVRTDLKWYQAKRFERARLNDWHVLRRFDRRSGDIRTSAAADVRRSGAYFPANNFDEIKILKSLEQTKGVASADKNCVGFFDSFLWNRCFVRGFDRVTHRTKPSPGSSGVSVLIMQSEGKKQYASRRPEETFDLRFDMIEIARP
jgi:hypothetical protein